MSQSYSGITLYYFYIGVIQNPSSVVYPDSFKVTFTGTPSGTQDSGLSVIYIPNLIQSATLTNSNSQAGTIDTYKFQFKLTSNIPRYGGIRLTFPSVWAKAP